MTADRPKRLNETKARTLADTAQLTKAADWSTTRAWNVTADDGTALLVVVPAYSGTARRGWTYRLGTLPPATDRWATREAAAVQGLMGVDPMGHRNPLTGRLAAPWT